jgi:hypothetical protein
MEVRVKAHGGHHLEQTRASSGTSVLSGYGAIASHAPCCGAVGAVVILLLAALQTLAGAWLARAFPRRNV